jgi:hypothetical protein
MKPIALLFLVASAFTVETDIYVFGLSRHTYRDECADGLRPKEQNPGAGLGVMLPLSESWEAGFTVGWYEDSQRDIARFAMPIVRYTWENRLCADAGYGYYKGSCFPGMGGLITVGVRTIGPIWIQGIYVPPLVTRVSYGVGIGFLRVRF